MISISDTAEKYLKAGINVIPVTKTKAPAVERLSIYFEEEYPEDLAAFKKAWGIGVICGEISDGVECIDFDPKISKEHIRTVFNAFAADPGVKSIMTRHKVYIQKTQSGGFHFVYKYECDDKRDGAKKLAKDPTGKHAIIETRGEGGYFVVSPSPGYEIKLNTVEGISQMTIDERDYLIEKARSFCMFKKEGVNSEQHITEDEHFENTDPVSFFNWTKSAYAKKLLEEEGWELVTKNDTAEQWRRPGKSEGISATWGFRYNSLYVFSTSAAPFEHQCYYTPFQILIKLRFKGSYGAALAWIIQKYFEKELPYIRVGVDYFKIIRKENRFNVICTELKPWKKDEIKIDHGNKTLETIAKFDDFIIKPNNKNYESIINNCYNLYAPFLHKPEKGPIEWSKRLMDHVFGKQIDLGWRYMKLLYEHPEKYGPILVLVSKDRSTGKTTFLNWLSMIFGDNVANISPADLTNSFNSAYAQKNITVVDETVIEKNETVEKLKALSTQKEITINQKFISQYKVPFYGKFILTSNKEDRFAKIDKEEIRFFVRKLGPPVHKNYNIEEDLLKEIPAFLYHLENNVPPVDFTLGRVPFTQEELDNESLKKVKDNSYTWLYKDLFEKIREYFFNSDMHEFQASIKDLIDHWYSRNNQVTVAYLKQVIRDEMNIDPSEKVIRYTLFYSEMGISKTGIPYTFKKMDFLNEKEISEIENDEITSYKQVPF